MVVHGLFFVNVVDLANGLQVQDLRSTQSSRWDMVLELLPERSCRFPSRRLRILNARSMEMLDVVRSLPRLARAAIVFETRR
jgi:hypothetical protein